MDINVKGMAMNVDIGQSSRMDTNVIIANASRLDTNVMMDYQFDIGWA